MGMGSVLPAGKIAQRMVKEGFRFWRYTRGLPKRPDSGIITSGAPTDAADTTLKADATVDGADTANSGAGDSDKYAAEPIQTKTSNSVQQSSVEYAADSLQYRIKAEPADMFYTDNHSSSNSISDRQSGTYT